VRRGHFCVVCVINHSSVRAAFFFFFNPHCICNL
jgi:hypothetical protein